MEDNLGILWNIFIPLLQRAAAELGKNIVIVMHDINFASCYSDYIVARRNDKVAVQGPPHDIVRPNVLQAVYDTTFEVRELRGTASSPTSSERSTPAACVGRFSVMGQHAPKLCSPRSSPPIGTKWLFSLAKDRK